MPPQVTSLARKPLSIAFEEIAADKIVGIAPDPVEELGGFDVTTFDPSAFEGTFEAEGDLRGGDGSDVDAVDAADAGDAEAGTRRRRV